jgi:hypothetical protein
MSLMTVQMIILDKFVNFLSRPACWRFDGKSSSNITITECYLQVSALCIPEFFSISAIWASPAHLLISTQSHFRRLYHQLSEILMFSSHRVESEIGMLHSVFTVYFLLPSSSPGFGQGDFSLVLHQNCLMCLTTLSDREGKESRMRNGKIAVEYFEGALEWGHLYGETWET